MVAVRRSRPLARSPALAGTSDASSAPRACGTVVPIIRIRIERAVDNAHERARQIGPRGRQAASASRRREPRELLSAIARARDTFPSRGDRGARRDCRRRSTRSAARPASTSGAMQTGVPASSRASRCQCLVELEPGAEVRQHRRPSEVAHHVLGLDVAMDQAGTMDGGQRIRELDADR